MQRRAFNQQALIGSLAGVFSASASRAAFAAEAAPKRILLRSGWQVVNIGDIAHTPGVMTLLEKHLPGAEVRLWASRDMTPAVMALEQKRFPKLQIVKGTIGDDGQASTPELAAALDWCDFLLHGSGPALVAARDVAAFDKHLRKPFGVFGITFSGGPPVQIETLTRAKFVYFRDTVSLQRAKDDGVKCPVMEFGPDGAFACDLRNDAAAEAFLREHKLETGKFLCCIPRLRYTPYWTIRDTPKDETKQARNVEMEEHDHLPLREAITRVVREAGLQVLVCPEDQTQMAVGKRNLIDQLPADVLKRVVWRENFWLTDEALSTYVRSAGLFGLEMHSPIMCIGAGVPAIVGRFAEQTTKGFMWRDIGLGDWLFDFDQPADLARYPAAVLELARDPALAQKKAAAARDLVQKKQQAMVERLGKVLG